MLTALASSAVVLLAAAPAPGPVDDGWSRGDVLVGSGGTLPASGAAQPSSEATVSLHFFRPVSLAAQLRVTALWGSRPGYGVGGGLGVRVAIGRRLFARAVLGGGFVTACLAGDYCGGVGFSASAELGAGFFRPGAHLVIVGRLHVQTGLVNGVSVALTPTLNVGLGF